jgi:D-3-phosphoglycerate dehydrogenase / 2-oxoglutarate reductase
MKLKILNTIGEKYTDDAKKILSRLGSVDYIKPSTSEMVEIADKYDVIIVGSYPKLNKDVLDKASRLKAIASITVNLDHIDIDRVRARNISVISLKGETEFLSRITSTAELAVGLMIDLMRNVPWAYDSVKNYSWDREKFRGHSLRGKTLGIAGLGRLGKMMARYGNAFYMNVIAYSPTTSNKIFNEAGCRSVSFKEMLKESDVISIHVPFSDKTVNMFDKKAFPLMKKSAIIVNTSVRTIVNEENLLAALKAKKIAGYACDVLSDELEFDEGFRNHPLVEYAKVNNNVIITPHIGGTTYESREATDIFIANALKDFL